MTQNKNEQDSPSNSGPNGRNTQPELLLEIAKNLFELFHDENKEPFVFFNNEVINLSSREIKNLLSYEFYKKKGRVPNNDALTQAINTLKAQASFDSKKHILHNRIAKSENGKYIRYDLGEGKVVRISSESWKIFKAPILFARYSHQQPQVKPLSDGNAWEIFDFLNFEDEDKLLVLVSIISFFIPDIPHPIIHPHGAQGSGKTTFCKVIKKLADPSSMETIISPKNAYELVQLLAHHHVSFFDNLSSFPGWMSDILAQACTGGGFSKRQLFSDDNDVIFHLKRCVGLNGINLLISKPDLMDRSILLRLKRIAPANRTGEDTIWNDFEEVRPYILGGIFDAISKAMKIYPTVKLKHLPRMADFTKWGYAITKALGKDPKVFLKDYKRNRSLQNDEIIRDSTLAQAVLMLVNQYDKWSGTLKEAWEELSGLVGYDKLDNTFPRTERTLRQYLERLEVNLIDSGVKFSIGKKTSKGIPISFRKVAKLRSLSSPSSPENKPDLQKTLTVGDGKMD